MFPDAKFRLNRPIGFSQGKLHGRFRNGVVCRWTGYAHEYFLLHLLRYTFLSPFFLGSIWMLAGYLLAPESPYSAQLRNEHKKQQKIRLKNLLRNPNKNLKEMYS